jgi:uncharacterized alkaline shock family protein YloU
MEEKTTDVPRPPGKTTIAPEVLLTIARLSTLEIQGVSRMAPVPGGVSWIPKRSQADGIRIEIEDDQVFADIHVILHHNVNVRDVSRNIQREVTRAISEMVGMEVGRVNIHIEDIDYPTETTLEA